MTRRARAYTRLDVEERRRRLLELGRGLFTRYPYDELSMAAIAREAGISKALLYHYFPSKQAYFVATLHDAAAELAERIRPDPAQPPADQLSGALRTWLTWVDENREGYGKLMRGASAVSGVRELVDRVRDETASLILARLWTAAGGDAVASAPPELRAAVRGWLWFMDGVCLDWVDHGDLEREQLHRLLFGTLPGAVAASGHGALLERLALAG
jgi:AcrR family transcriptional regulator